MQRQRAGSAAGGSPDTMETKMEMQTREALKALLGIETDYRRRSGLRAWAAGMLERLGRAAARRRDYAILMRKSERELADIGLTRADVIAARYGYRNR